MTGGRGIINQTDRSFAEASEADLILARGNPFLTVSVATTIAEIKDLEAAWRGLELRASNKMALFQGFDWNLNWVETWFKPAEKADAASTPFVVAIWQDDVLVSIWPLQTGSTAGVRTLTWLSSPALQYGDALIDPDCDFCAVCLKAWDTIIDSKETDLLSFDNVAANSPIYGFLSNKCTSAGGTKASILEIGHYSDWQAYQTSLKKTARRARRKRHNKLAKSGDMTFRVHQSPSAYKRLVDIAINWKRQWLEQQHWPGSLMGEPAFKAFVQANAHYSPNSPGRWVAAELCIDGDPVAIELGAVYANRYYSFLGAFNLAWAKFSPGKIELEEMIAWAMEKGIADFDFLCVPAQYKSDWTDHSIPVERFTHACNLRGRILHSVWLKRLRPAMKYSLQKVPQAQRKIFTELFEKRLKG